MSTFFFCLFEEKIYFLQSATTSYFDALYRISESRIAVNIYLFNLVCAAKVAQRREEIQG